MISVRKPAETDDGIGLIGQECEQEGSYLDLLD